MRKFLPEQVSNQLCVGATRNSKEIQPGLVQNKFDLFGSNLAYFLLACPL
jgi:hypothetical protein